MSQIYLPVSSTPSVPTSFVTNEGTAVPAANVLNVLGGTQAPEGTPVETEGAGNTLSILVQIANASGASVAGNAGLASFNSTQFTVDANGFVSLAGGGAAQTITGNSGGALSPTAGNWNILGTGSITTSGAGSTLTAQLTGLTNHAVLVGAGTATITNVGPTATAGQILQSQGLGADPAFSTATYPATTTVNQILYSNTGNQVVGLATANQAVLTTGATGTPVLTPLATDGQLIIGSTAGVPAAATLTAGTGITITNASNSITIAVTSGSTVIETITGNTGGAESPSAGNFNILGTGSITVAGSANTETVQLTGLTNHAVLVGAGTATITKIAATANTGAVLQNNSGADPSYSTATYPSTTTINQILYSSAANTVSGLATANQAVLTTGATGVPVLTALATDGQLIIGSTAGVPAAATLTAGSGITITNASNSITIAVTSGSTVIETITGNSGGAESPSAGNFNILGTGSITVAGSANTETVQLTGLTNHAVLVGAGTATITKVGPSASTGQILQNNAGADPSYSTATYPSASVGSGKILFDNGTNFVTSTPTFPASASATTRKIIVSDGTNWVASTETWAVPGTSGNILTSDGTNWTSSGNGITTVGDVTTGHVAFDGTAGTTLTSTTSGMTVTAANNSGGTGANVLLKGGPTTNSGSTGGQAQVTGGSGNGAGGGGNAVITGGTAGATGSGGSVILQGAGGGATSGQGGVFQILGGTGTGTNTNSRDSTINNTIGTGTGTTGHISIKCDAQGGVSGSTAHTSQFRHVFNGFLALTSGAAANVVSSTISSGSWAQGTIFYYIECTDGTNFQSLSGIVAFAQTNKAGTITGTTSVIGTEAKNLTSGTLTTSWAANGSGQVQCTPTTSLTATTFRMIYNFSFGGQENVGFG